MSERQHDQYRQRSYDPRVEGRGAQVREPRDADGPHDPDLWRDPRLPPPDPWGGLRGDAPRTGSRAHTDTWHGGHRSEQGLQGNYGDVGRSFGFDAGHRGRGFRPPKGYQRSDERIHEDVSERLALQRWIDPSDIEVGVAKGEVTLTGTVRSREEKFHAEELVASVPGVTDVDNRLRVRRDDR